MVSSDWMLMTVPIHLGNSQAGGKNYPFYRDKKYRKASTRAMDVPRRKSLDFIHVLELGIIFNFLSYEIAPGDGI